MLRLYILRHVASNHTTPGQRDIDRGISERGIATLDKISSTISYNEYFPKTLYCSPALRTQQTFSGIKDVFAKQPKTLAPEQLYAGITDDYYTLISNHQKAEPLMIIGHNPMCSDFAYSICSTGAPELLRKIVMGFSEGSLAVIDFDIDDWSKLGQKIGHVVDFQNHTD